MPHVALADAHHAAHGAAYVHVIVNEGREAGASLPHTHAQLVALDSCPPLSPASASASAPTRRAPRAATCSTTSSRRRCAGASGSSPSTTRPWCSRRSRRAAPYHLLIAPRRPATRFEDDGPLGAGALHDTLARLAPRFGARPPLNLWVRTAPRGAEHFCWRIDILPRLAQLAGLELGTGVHLNAVAPERAARELRDA